MIRRPPRYTRTDTLFPYTTLFRSHLLQYQAGVIRNQPLFGFWPASMAPRLDAWLANQARRDMRGWIAYSQAREIDADFSSSNLNTPAEDRQRTRLNSSYYCASRISFIA